MKSIILPIKSIYVKKIFNGEKIYEYRRRLCKKDIDKILIYETSPIKKVVGEAIVEEKLIYDKETLWEISKDFSGISKEVYNLYFSKCEKCCAYKLSKIKKSDNPKRLSEYGINHTIQSFEYI